MSAFSYFGALRFLQVEKMDRYLHHVAGTSMGAIFAAAMALRIPLEEIEMRLLQYVDDDTRNNIPYPDILACIQKLGLDDSSRYVRILEPEISKMTFRDLSKKTGMNLVVCATHISTLEPVYFSVDTTPNVLVLDALSASIAVPWLFTPVRIGNDEYVDGGVADNVPFQPFDKVDPKNVLILHTYSKTSFLPKGKRPHEVPVEYSIALISRFFTQVSGAPYFSMRFPHYILLDDSPLPFVKLEFLDDKMRMHITKDDIDKAFTYGYETLYKRFSPLLQSS